jgi:hypothetical protein
MWEVDWEETDDDAERWTEDWGEEAVVLVYPDELANPD